MHSVPLGVFYTFIHGIHKFLESHPNVTLKVYSTVYNTNTHGSVIGSN